MRDENHIRTLRDYSKPSHDGYRNTIELPIGNNVNDTKEFVKPVKANSTPQSSSKAPDQRLLELEDQINFLLKGSRPTPRPILMHIPQAYAEAFYSNPRPQNQNEPPKQNPFTLHKRIGPNPQPQALGTTFEARVRDYMAAHTKRMERFKNIIFKQSEEINDRMTEMFGLLKKLTTSRTPEKVLIREETKFLVTKNVNFISFARGEEERSDKIDVATGNDIENPTRTDARMQANEAEKENEAGKEEMTESKKRIKNDIEPIVLIMTMNRLVLEWEERLKLHLEREMEFDQWKSKNFKSKHHALIRVKGEMDDEGEVT
nr:hypothetical protein [Tanacetum cinerariifolium]